MTTSIDITFEGKDLSLEKGIDLDVLSKVVRAFQETVGRVAADLSGVDASSDSVADAASRLVSSRLTGVTPGSVVAHIDFSQPTDSQTPLIDVTEDALDRIMRWQTDDRESLPAAARDALEGIGELLTSDIDRVTIGRPGESAVIHCPRRNRAKRRVQQHEEIGATLYGRLHEVNWAKGTAQLHNYFGDGYVNLKFGKALAFAMRELATESVRIKGRGRVNTDDEWVSVTVEEIESASGRHPPFDLEAFLNNPNPKVFDPAQKPPPINLTDEEWESFNKAIKEGRKR